MKTSESGGGVVTNGDRVAVVCQRGRAWSLPKGHVEKGETLLDAARREIREECGITDLVLVGELGTYGRHKMKKDPTKEKRKVWKNLTFFHFTSGQEELQPEDPKILEARWIPKDEVAALLTHPKDREFYEGLNL